MMRCSWRAVADLKEVKRPVSWPRVVAELCSDSPRVNVEVNAVSHRLSESVSTYLGTVAVEVGRSALE